MAEDLKPSKTVQELGLSCVIAEKNEDGTYLALYRTPLGTEYKEVDDFVVCIYNKKKKLMYEYNLSDFAGFAGCEVQDVRYSEGYIFFNMPYISYSSGVDGQCSKLYCFDPKTSDVVWETPYLCSNGIFIVQGRYVICGYGFTNEDDYVYLVDAHSGDVLTELPVYSSPVYYEFNDNELLCVVDYNDNFYVLTIEENGVKVTGKGVRMRLGPSTDDPVYSEREDGRAAYAMKGDVLQYRGEEGDFYKVIYNGTPVYISKQFSELVGKPVEE